VIVIVCACVSFLPAGFIGLTAATAGDFPWAAAWQSGIICPDGQQLMSQETTAFIYTEPYSETGPDGHLGHTGGGFSFRCSGDDPDVNRNGQVMLMQFLAGALLSYPLTLAGLLAIALTIRRTVNTRYLNSVRPWPTWPGGAPAQ
jgi:hypothetical protein